MEEFYDDAGVTLGDDGTSVDQGIFGIQRVGGSKSFVRDPRLSKLAASVMDKPGRPGASRAERTQAHYVIGHKWCSEHADGDGWMPLSDFSPDPRYRDGKKPICKLCSARLERRRYALIREAQGYTVKPYGERRREPPAVIDRSWEDRPRSG